jgi:hypothetical protein
MTIGVGKYDEEAGMVLQRTNARAVILIVIGGNRGEGFSVQAYEDIAPVLPKLLRHTADEIEKDMQA